MGLFNLALCGDGDEEASRAHAQLCGVVAVPALWEVQEASGRPDRHRPGGSEATHPEEAGAAPRGRHRARGRPRGGRAAPPADTLCAIYSHVIVKNR